MSRAAVAGLALAAGLCAGGAAAWGVLRAPRPSIEVLSLTVEAPEAGPRTLVAEVIVRNSGGQAAFLHSAAIVRLRRPDGGTSAVRMGADIDEDGAPDRNGLLDLAAGELSFLRLESLGPEPSTGAWDGALAGTVSMEHVAPGGRAWVVRSRPYAGDLSGPDGVYQRLEAAQ